jgi:hypothetical protein
LIHALAVREMQLMHHAMKHRCENESGDADQHEPGIERIDAFKHLAAFVLRLAVRPHAAEYHGGMTEGSAQVEPFEIAIAENSNG